MTEHFEWFRDWTPEALRTDRVVLDKWNGRPTLVVDLCEQGIVLQWLLLGQVEPFDVWLTSPITGDEADELILRTPQDLGEWVAQKKGRGALIRLDRFAPGGAGPVTVVQESWIIPGGGGGINDALLSLSEAVKAQFGHAPQHTTPAELERILELLNPMLTA